MLAEDLLAVLRIEYEKARTGGQSGGYQPAYGGYGAQGADQYAGYYQVSERLLPGELSLHLCRTAKAPLPMALNRQQLPQLVVLHLANYLSKEQKHGPSMRHTGRHTATMSTTRSVSVACGGLADVR